MIRSNKQPAVAAHLKYFARLQAGHIYGRHESRHGSWVHKEENNDCGRRLYLSLTLIQCLLFTECLMLCVTLGRHSAQCIHKVNHNWAAGAAHCGIGMCIKCVQSTRCITSNKKESHRWLGLQLRNLLSEEQEQPYNYC